MKTFCELEAALYITQAERDGLKATLDKALELLENQRADHND